MDFMIQHAAQVLTTVGAPFVLGLLAVGTTVGVLQAATQVNDPALGAVPRLAVAVGLAVSLGGWVAENLASFLTVSLEQIAKGP